MVHYTVAQTELMNVTLTVSNSTPQYMIVVTITLFSVTDIFGKVAPT